jgi:hypothetical protein
MSAVVLYVQNYSFLPSFVASQVVPGPKQNNQNWLRLPMPEGINYFN